MLPFHEQTDFEFMPQLSRYSDEHVEQLLSELTSVLETHKAPVDLSLMVLGNMVTNLINSSVAPAQRQAIARFFCPGAAVIYQRRSGALRITNNSIW